MRDLASKAVVCLQNLGLLKSVAHSRIGDSAWILPLISSHYVGRALIALLHRQWWIALRIRRSMPNSANHLCARRGNQRATFIVSIAGQISLTLSIGRNPLPDRRSCICSFAESIAWRWMPGIDNMSSRRNLRAKLTVYFGSAETKSINWPAVPGTVMPATCPLRPRSSRGEMQELQSRAATWGRGGLYREVGGANCSGLSWKSGNRFSHPQQVLVKMFSICACCSFLCVCVCVCLSKEQRRRCKIMILMLQIFSQT